MAIVFKAREATIKIEDAITITTGGPLDDDFAASAETQVKNITITLPEGAIEIINTLGETSNFQNAYSDIKGFGLATCTGTMILDGDENNPFKEAMGGTGTSITGGYTRYQMGSSASGNTRTGTSAILLNLDNSSEECNVVLDNVFFKIGEIKPTDAEGHFEFDFECWCLPKDAYVEFKN